MSRFQDGGGRGRGGGGRGDGGRGRGGGGGGRGRGGRGGRGRGRGRGDASATSEFGGLNSNKGRASKTNRSKEAKRFSTVKTPKKSEVKTINQRPLAPEMRAGIRNLQPSQTPAQQKVSSMDITGSGNEVAGGAFDPIPNDGMFVVVDHSTLWPPPPLMSLPHFSASIKQKTGGSHNINNHNDGSLAVDDAAVGLDQFDRVSDEKERRKQAEKLVKQQRKANPGELVHPRGKAPVNMKVKLEDSSDDDG